MVEVAFGRTALVMKLDMRKNMEETALREVEGIAYFEYIKMFHSVGV